MGAERTLGRRRGRSRQPYKEEARKQHEQYTIKVIKPKAVEKKSIKMG